MQGNARLYGALLLGRSNQNLRFKIKNTAAVRYSSQALNLVQTLWGSLLPQPPKLIAWNEVMQ